MLRNIHLEQANGNDFRSLWPAFDIVHSNIFPLVQLSVTSILQCVAEKNALQFVANSFKSQQMHTRVIFYYINILLLMNRKIIEYKIIAFL